MALEATAQVEAQVMAQRFYGSFENRFSSFGAIKSYFDNAAALLPVDQLKRIKNAGNARDIAFPIMTKQNLTVITERSCNLLGVEPVSQKPTFTTIIRGFEIKLYPMVLDNNEFSMQQAYAQQMANGLRSVFSNLDTFAAAQLEAGKSTSLATVDLPGVTINANAYEIDFDNADDLYFILPTILEKNDVRQFDHNNIANSEARKRMLEYESFGTDNNQNRRGVLDGNLPSANGFRHYTSNRIVPGAGIQETHYLVPFGGIGAFTYNHNDAVAGRRIETQQMYLQTDTIFGVTWDVREQGICDDLSATYGDEYKAVYGTKYQFAANFVFMNAFSSDTSRANLKVNVMKEVAP